MKIKYRDCEIEYNKDGDEWCWSILRLSDLLEIDCGRYPASFSKEEVVADCKVGVDDFLQEREVEAAEELQYGLDLDDIRVTWKDELDTLKLYLDITPGIFVGEEFVYDYERLLECLVEFKNGENAEQILEIYSSIAMDKPKIDFDIIAGMLNDSDYATENISGWELVEEDKEALNIINTILHQCIICTPLYQRNELLFTLDITEVDDGT